MLSLNVTKQNILIKKLIIYIQLYRDELRNVIFRYEMKRKVDLVKALLYSIKWSFLDCIQLLSSIYRTSRLTENLAFLASNWKYLIGILKVSCSEKRLAPRLRLLSRIFFLDNNKLHQPLWKAVMAVRWQTVFGRQCPVEEPLQMWGPEKGTCKHSATLCNCDYQMRSRQRTDYYHYI